MGHIYRNHGALTQGVTEETADGMSLRKIQAIIQALRFERYRWHPVQRVYIPKKDGKQRPPHSHGFRPERGCHTALREIYHGWVGTAWFLEGDISKCFDSLDHAVLLSRLRQHFHDERFLRLMAGLLNAGYLEDWTWHATYSRAPQGSIVGPILSNLYLDVLDQFVETVLIPEYTRGQRRKFNPAYEQLRHSANYQARKGRKVAARALRQQAQRLPSIDPQDPDYRRLRYCRYADDFLCAI